MRFMRLIKSGTVAGAAFALAASLLAATGGAAAAGGATLYVSPSGASGHAGRSCATATFSSINAAVAAAPGGGTVIVCQGTYAEDVQVAKALTLKGRHARIDATGLDNGIVIVHSRVEVRGFLVFGATGEGILAMGTPTPAPVTSGETPPSGTPITNVNINHNRVRGNDQGGPDSTYVECQPQGEIPGDCGEGIHLMSVAHSRVVANKVSRNSGGILLTDEFGPNHGNLIARNVVEDNLFDCGITLASHNTGVDPTTLARLRSMGGVYDNWIVRNVTTGNGTLGEGAGILIAAAFPSAAAYHNHVIGNFASGNELSGITIHAHAPGSFVGNNILLHNKIGKNNTGGDPDAADGEHDRDPGPVHRHADPRHHPPEPDLRQQHRHLARHRRACARPCDHQHVRERCHEGVPPVAPEAPTRRGAHQSNGRHLRPLAHAGRFFIVDRITIRPRVRATRVAEARVACEHVAVPCRWGGRTSNSSGGGIPCVCS